MSDSNAGKKAPQNDRAVPPGVLQYLLEIKQRDGKRRLENIAKLVCDEAGDRLLRGEFPSELFQRTSFKAFVVSLDLRRSSDMMLLAKDADCFASFMWRLFNKLGEIIKSDFGVIEKFTGDGILAYFPVDFAGDHAGYRAVRACQNSLDYFVKCYAQARSHFTCVLEDFGPCAGIDFGEVQFREITDTPSILGKPVVFASRLSSGPRAAVLVNQPAYDELQAACPGAVHFDDASLEIKHLGSIACFKLKRHDSAFPPENPDWYKRSPPANG